MGVVARLRGKTKKTKPKPKQSRIPGFHKLSIPERLAKVIEFTSLNESEKKILEKPTSLNLEDAEHMVENVISSMPFPFCIATNFIINGKEYLIPMVAEEPSVVAGASNVAKKVRNTGGFKVKGYQRSIIIGQIQLVKVKNFANLLRKIKSHKDKIINLANKELRGMVKRGGGAIDLSVQIFKETKTSPMATVNIEIDSKDAHGANIATRAAEAVAPYIEKITKTKTNLKIVSNLPTKRIVEAKATFHKDEVGGNKVVDRILEAYALAEVDIFRAATHNKGIMNGICAVALATANDLEALESGMHAFAAIDGRYKSLSKWSKDKEGNLVGILRVPIQVGTVGGLISVHPIAKIALKILGNPDAKKLSMVLAAVGLAQNAAALMNLADKGIVHGHLKLHVKNIAKMAGTTNKELQTVVDKMLKEGVYTTARARGILKEIRS